MDQITKDFIGQSKPFLVSVEGNVGSGKSTMLQFFQQHFSPLEIAVFPEPVEKWRNVGGQNLLELKFRDPERWFFQFQTYSLLTRLEIAKAPTDSKVKLIERSIPSNRHCFLPVAAAAGSSGRSQLHESELAILESLHEHLSSSSSSSPVDLFVYLRTRPEEAMERARERGRGEEEGTVTLEFLERLHEAHESWLVKGDRGKVGAPVVVVEAGGKTRMEMEETFNRLWVKIGGEERLGKDEVFIL